MNANKSLFFSLIIMALAFKGSACIAMDVDLTKAQEQIAKLEEELKRSKNELEDQKNNTASVTKQQQDKQEQELQRLKDSIAQHETKTDDLQKQQKKLQDDLTKKTQKKNKYKDRARVEVGHSTYTTPPEGTKDSINALNEAQINQLTYNNSWGKLAIDTARGTGTHVVVPLVIQQASPIVTELRQNHLYKTHAEAREDRIAEKIERSADLKVQTLEQNISRGKKTQENENRLADAEVQTRMASQLRTLCEGNYSTCPICPEMTNLAAAVHLAQWKEAYKKQFGEDYVPTPTPASAKK